MTGAGVKITLTETEAVELAFRLEHDIRSDRPALKCLRIFQGSAEAESTARTLRESIAFAAAVRDKIAAAREPEKTP